MTGELEPFVLMMGPLHREGLEARQDREAFLQYKTTKTFF
jgi:hypothetical protein